MVFIYKMSTSVSSKFICKCCLEYSSCLTDLWSEYSYKAEPEIYGEMLTKCFAISWSPQEPNTEHICESCIKHLRDACAFKSRILMAEQVLLDNLNEDHSPDNKELKITPSEIDDLLHTNILRTKKEFTISDPPANDFDAKETLIDSKKYSFSDCTETNEQTVKESSIDEEYCTNNDLLIKRFSTNVDGTICEDEEFTDVEYLELEDDDEVQESFVICSDESMNNSFTEEINKETNENLLEIITDGERENGYDTVGNANETLVLNIQNVIQNYGICKQTNNNRNNSKEKITVSSANVVPNHRNDILEKVMNKRELTIKKSCSKAVKKTFLHKEKFTEESVKNSNERSHQFSNLRQIFLCSNASPLTVHSDKGFNCYFCENYFQEPTDLKFHMRSVHRGKLSTFMAKTYIDDLSFKLDITNLHCTLCGKFVFNLIALLMHLRDNHDKAVYLDLINRMIEIKFEGDNFKCFMCNKPISKFRKLVVHMSQHYKSFQCQYCVTCFMTPRRLKKHIAVKHERIGFSCSKCPRVCKTKQSLDTHVYKIHQLQQTGLKCGFCEMSFEQKEAKLMHLKYIHGVERAFLGCSLCDKIFAKRSHLIKHIRRHTNTTPKRHKCPICGKMFESPSFLKTRHMIKHTKEKNYHCAVCHKALGSKSAITMHMRIHNDDRRYKCAKCGESFVHNKSRILHESKYCPKVCI